MILAISELLDIKYYSFIQCLAFKIIGIDITSHTKPLKRPWLTLLTCGNLLILMTSMCHFSWKHSDDFDKVTASLSPFLQSLLSIFKVCILIYNRENMISLINRLWVMTIKADDEELKIIREENLRETVLSRCYGIVVIVTAGALCIPLFIYIYTTLVNLESIEDNIEKFMPFQMSFLIDPAPRLNYFILYLWLLGALTFVICGSLGVDTLFCWYVYNVAAQFRMLRRNIQQVAANHSLDHAQLESSLHLFIRKHQRAFDNCQELNLVFKLIIFIEFFLNCLQICFLAYQLGRGVALQNMPFLSLFQVSVAVQLLIYSHGGQRIENESQSVAAEINRSFNWYQMPIRMRKTLLLSILRAQRCYNLSGCFFILDLRMYLLVYRNAASYVSLLWSIME